MRTLATTDTDVMWRMTVETISEKNRRRNLISYGPTRTDHSTREAPYTLE